MYDFNCIFLMKSRNPLISMGVLCFLSARRKAQFKKAWKNDPLYPDWQKEVIKAANVTLDEATAHPALLVSERGRRVTWQETCQDLPSSTQRFSSIPCVLGQLRINSGRAYWEVEVGTCNLGTWEFVEIM
uniref:B30.2/SPRY domain-containing protein n=1 Tax=Sus scrofa TaxID=9823 RepID=A0A4X1V5D1_PIG